MDTKDFARRYGYLEPQIVFESPDELPEDVRDEVVRLIVQCFKNPYEVDLLVGVMRSVLPATEELWGELRSVPRPRLVTNYSREPWSQPKLVYSDVADHLMWPLSDCDWRLFYTVVERVCAEWGRLRLTHEGRFAPEFNLLLRSHRIPFELHSGRVIPAADSEFADNLEYVRQALGSLESEDSNDPHVLLKDALDGLYRKQPGPDLSSACVNAWGAWKAAAGEASGRGERDKRAFDWVKSNYPMLHDTMNAWRKLAESGRHPETEGSPTESETRFIVMLCVNAVRLLNEARNGASNA